MESPVKDVPPNVIWLAVVVTVKEAIAVLDVTLHEGAFVQEAPKLREHAVTIPVPTVIWPELSVL